MPKAGQHLTPEQRAELVKLSASGLVPVAIARAMGVDDETVSRWRDRYLSGENPTLKGRSTAPKTNPRRYTEAVLAAVVDLRREGRTRKGIEIATGFSTSVVNGVLRTQGLGNRKAAGLAFPSTTPAPPAPRASTNGGHITPDQRAELIRMAQAGTSLAEIGRRTGIHWQTVKRWRDRWRAEGDGAPHGHRAGRKKAPNALMPSPETVTAILDLRRSGATWARIKAAGFRRSQVERVLAVHGIGRCQCCSTPARVAAVRTRLPTEAGKATPPPVIRATPRRVCTALDERSEVLRRLFQEGASHGEMARAIDRSRPRVGQLLRAMGLCRADHPKPPGATPEQRQAEREAEALRRAIARVERRGLPVGVLLMPNGRYRAKLGTRQIGYFDTVEDAVRARAEAARVAGEGVEKTA